MGKKNLQDKRKKISSVLVWLGLVFVLGLFGVLMYQSIQTKADIRSDRERFTETDKKNNGFLIN